jgi:hypothetical protein
MTETWSVSPSVNMLPFGVTIPVTVPQGSEIPEGLMNKPVYNYIAMHGAKKKKKKIPNGSYIKGRNRGKKFGAERAKLWIDCIAEPIYSTL